MRACVRVRGEGSSRDGARFGYENAREFNRYCTLLADDGGDAQNETLEEVREGDEDERGDGATHRHYDSFMESQPVGKRYTARCPGVPSAKRRMYSRMACSRVPSLEPIGESREMFYQQRLFRKDGIFNRRKSRNAHCCYTRYGVNFRL